jgi:flagellar assembly factor FliW
MSSYELPLSGDEAELLRLDQMGDVAVLLVLSKSEVGTATLGVGEARIRPNITAPILVNTQTRIGFQKLLTDLAYNIAFHVPHRNDGG